VQNYFTQNSFSRKISRFSAFLFFAVIVGVLAGCSGGSDSKTAAASATTPTTPTTPVIPAVATIQLLASNTQVASAGTNTVDLTAIVLSASRQTISGKNVTFSAGNDATAFINNISASGVSDANGLVTAKLNVGGDKTNRAITVSATAESVTATNNVDVTGTTMTISGDSSLAFGKTTTLTFSVKDSAGNALRNTPVTLTSQNGNTITTATSITDPAGQITADITASSAAAALAGKDVITASAAGGSATQTLTISSASFTLAVSSPNPPCVRITGLEIPLFNPADPCSTPTVSANWKIAGVAQANTAVTFSASRGTVVGSPATTNAAGDTPGVTISSTTAGPARITASGPGGTPATTLDVVFVATSASSATVQAIPGTVQFTTTATTGSGQTNQTNNTSTISVQVRDAANNLVKNAGVRFTIAVDPSGGQLTSSSGTTDASGSTSVTYKAGGTSSAQNGVTIVATVDSIGGLPISPVVTGSTTLTVSGQALQVRLGTDNKVAITPLPQNANQKTYLAIVTDAAGNPAAGVNVQFALRPARYRKGVFLFDTLNKVWFQVVSVTCPNEDLNFNGILDPGEGLVAFPAGVTPALLPGTTATVNGTALSDASGIATAIITYPKDHSLWSEVTLEARTSVTSNDPPTQAVFFLPGSGPDYVDANSPPPGVASPYGVNSSCADTL